MTQTETDELQAAQERLLEKRSKLMGNLTPLTESISDEIKNIGRRCLERAKEEAKNNPPRIIELPVVHEEQTKPEPCKPVIPKRYAGCNFDNFQGNEKLISDLKEHAEKRHSILLMGNTGCGKTHLAIALAKFIQTHDKDGWRPVPGTIFIPVPELLLKARSSFREGSSMTEEELIDYYSRPELIILDDLGAEKTTEYTITTLYLILDRRIREERQTIVTTNFNLKQIEEIFGARIASRLADMTVIKINMPDWRKKRDK